MIRQIVLFLLRTYVLGVLRGRVRRVGLGVRKSFSVRNILGESVGMWWDMRRIR